VSEDKDLEEADGEPGKLFEDDDMMEHEE